MASKGKIKTSERIQRANLGAAFKADGWTSYMPASEAYRNNYDAIDWTGKSEKQGPERRRRKSRKKHLVCKADLPNPGTQAALDLGCKCPVLDNRDAGGYLFYYSAACELHCPGGELPDKQ